MLFYMYFCCVRVVVLLCWCIVVLLLRWRCFSLIFLCCYCDIVVELLLLLCGCSVLWHLCTSLLWNFFYYCYFVALLGCFCSYIALKLLCCYKCLCRLCYFACILLCWVVMLLCWDKRQRRSMLPSHSTFAQCYTVTACMTPLSYLCIWIHIIHVTQLIWLW